MIKFYICIETNNFVVFVYFSGGCLRKNKLTKFQAWILRPTEKKKKQHRLQKKISEFEQEPAYQEPLETQQMLTTIALKRWMKNSLFCKFQIVFLECMFGSIILCLSRSYTIYILD